ncbi:MAG: hypothetical protein ACYS22_01530 [Planctomycetota bacterium]
MSSGPRGLIDGLAHPDLVERLSGARTIDGERPEEVTAALRICSRPFQLRQLGRAVHDTVWPLRETVTWEGPELDFEPTRPNVVPEPSRVLCNQTFATERARKASLAVRALRRHLLRKEM